jgi:hypothetical protein
MRGQRAQPLFGGFVNPAILFGAMLLIAAAPFFMT